MYVFCPYNLRINVGLNQTNVDLGNKSSALNVSGNDAFSKIHNLGESLSNINLPDDLFVYFNTTSVDSKEVTSQNYRYFYIYFDQNGNHYSGTLVPANQFFGHTNIISYTDKESGVVVNGSVTSVDSTHISGATTHPQTPICVRGIGKILI